MVIIVIILQRLNVREDKGKNFITAISKMIPIPLFLFTFSRVSPFHLTAQLLCVFLCQSRGAKYMVAGIIRFVHGDWGIYLI